MADRGPQVCIGLPAYSAVQPSIIPDKPAPQPEMLGVADSESQLLHDATSVTPAEETKNNETNKKESRNGITNGQSGANPAGPSQISSVISKAEMGDLLHGSELHALEMNVWDAALLVGTRIHLPEETQPIYIDWWQVVNIVFLFCLNFLMQAGFIVASYLAYRDDNLLFRDGIYEAILHQRFYTHHEYHRVNWVTQQTEIASLCAGLHVSQLGILADDSQQYLDHSPMVSGDVLALLACLIWTISMWVEIRQCLSSFVSLIMIGSEAEDHIVQAATLQIGQSVQVLYEKEWYKAQVKAFPADDPEGRGRWTVECESDPPGTLTFSPDIRQISGGSVVESNTRLRSKGKAQIHLGGIRNSFVKRMSHRHKVLLLVLVTFPRLVLGVLLYMVGARFLAHTLEVGEIILNTCALEIVKQIDDILFMALASRGLQQVVGLCLLKSRDIDPNKLGMKKLFWTGWIAQCILILVAIVIVYVYLLVGFWDHVTDAEANICKNDLNFAFIEHPLSGMPVFVNVNYDEGPSFRNASLSIKGSPQDSLQCYYKSKTQLFKLKFETNDKSHKARLVKSESHECDKSGSDQWQCGTLPLADMRTLSLMTSSDIMLSGSYCVNQDTHLEILRDVCMRESVGDRVSRPLMHLFRSKALCSDWTEICMCPNLEHTCDQDEFMKCNITRQYGIDTVWIEVIRNICPCSCGMCSEPCQEYLVDGEVNFSRTFDTHLQSLAATGSGHHCPSQSLVDILGKRLRQGPRQRLSPGAALAPQSLSTTAPPPVMGAPPSRRLASLSEASRAAGAAKREAAGQTKGTVRAAPLLHSEVEAAALARRAAQLEHRASAERESEAAVQRQELRRLTAENEALVAELRQRPTRSEFEELRQSLEDIRQILKTALPSHSMQR